MKIDNFRGDLTDGSAEREALVMTLWETCRLSHCGMMFQYHFDQNRIVVCTKDL